MNAVLTYIVAAAALAQPWRPAPPQAGGQPEAQMPKFRVVAVYCSNRGEGVQAELENLKPLFEKLPYDTFEQVARHDTEAAPGQETKVPLNGVYTLYLTVGAPAQGAQQEGVPLEARVEMLADDGFVNALRASGRAAPNKALLFRGLPMDAGELAVVMMLLPPDQDNGQSQKEQEQQQQEKEEKEEQETQDQQQEQPQEQQQQQEQSEAEQREAEEDEQKDMQNIEAILQSLEEQDRREQHDTRNKRRDVQMRGGWW
mgnify:CR=1 FL=1